MTYRTTMANMCCMTGCTVKPAQDVYYFPLPTKPLLRRRWLQVIAPERKLAADASVCSAHFSRSDYETVRGRTRLKRDRVPGHVAEKKQDGDHSVSNGSKITKSYKKKKNIETKIDNVIEESVEDGGKLENGLEDSKLTENEVTIPDTICQGASETNGQGKNEAGDKMETESADVNGAESHDLNAVEIQITPDIIEDYNPIQVTPDIIEDYDAMKTSDSLCPSEHDIEDILTNYHIMHPPDRRDRLPEKPYEKPVDSGDKPVEKPSEKQNSNEKPSEKHTLSEKLIEENDVQTIDDDDDPPIGVSSAPVFIEIPVDKGRNSGSADCLLVLESVQVSVDPRALALAARDCDDDDEDKGYDPISLLTSSDEDDVIIQEPHVDTVEVSDETDEDDVPLVRLVKHEPDTALTADIAKVFWGAQEYYCTHCKFVTFSSTQYRRHVKTHTTTAIQICQVCGFTTASEYQFSRHKKKHKEDKRYKCHLCDYKARHNMSLIYHLKVHEKEGRKSVRCQNCGFKSSVRSVILKHMKSCRKVFKCDKCRYSTKRRSDLKRHVKRKHQGSDDDDDTWV
ncbi:zinc finger Y-chromosomal protein-like [Plodia interpunctella]|uniref:zinc finger Y-chromosomal protein-like n=1 Tax=Plodia interpunctella TaxID=58824 RepID=UPI0023684D13|nr:zinc finger Y-chromosomal protein-like [Plodia interpunctella]